MEVASEEAGGGGGWRTADHASQQKNEKWKASERRKEEGDKVHSSSPGTHEGGGRGFYSERKLVHEENTKSFSWCVLVLFLANIKKITLVVHKAIQLAR